LTLRIFIIITLLYLQLETKIDYDYWES